MRHMRRHKQRLLILLRTIQYNTCQSGSTNISNASRLELPLDGTRDDIPMASLSRPRRLDMFARITPVLHRAVAHTVHDVSASTPRGARFRKGHHSRPHEHTEFLLKFGEDAFPPPLLPPSPKCALSRQLSLKHNRTRKKKCSQLSPAEDARFHTPSLPATKYQVYLKFLLP